MQIDLFNVASFAKQYYDRRPDPSWDEPGIIPKKTKTTRRGRQRDWAQGWLTIRNVQIEGGSDRQYLIYRWRECGQVRSRNLSADTWELVKARIEAGCVSSMICRELGID